MSFYRLRREGVACSDLGSEFLILDLDTSAYFSASASAAVLVEALVDGASPETLVDRLVAEYDVAVVDAAADVDAFLAQMLRRNLVDTVAP